MRESDLETDAGTDRDRFDLLAEEFVEKLRRGEAPSVSAFAARDPDHRDEVQALLASVALIEQLKRHRLQSRPETVAPQQLGDFRIIRELGRGGMGIVYEAEQTTLGRRVAVKVLPSHSLLDPSRKRRFQHEAQTAAALHHTNIVPIFGVGEFQGLHYLVMQLIDGRGLDIVLDDWRRSKTGPIEKDLAEPLHEEEASKSHARAGHWRQVARIGVQAAEALHYAHDQGVLHRDIKPANLLLDRHGVAWITDFGLAKTVERESLSNSGDVIGTLQYMAPERFETEADARSDVYSLGLTLYELLTLEPAFREASPSMLIRKVSEGHPARPRDRNPAIPVDLETIILKAIAREPEHRYATAGALADDLNRFLDDRPVLARRASPIERLTRWSRRNKTVAALSAAVLLSLIVAAATGWVGYASTTQALTRESARRDEAEAAKLRAEAATQRSEQNVALSLQAFEDLFQRIAPRDGGPPDQLEPLDGPNPPPPPPPPRLDDPMHPDDGGRPPQGGPQGKPEDMSELLQGVLSFYDRFAVKNATNDHLHREAARAYRRVGDLQRRLGQDLAAEAAFARSAELYESLVATDPNDRASKYELASACARIEPTSDDPDALRRVERSLTRAQELAASLARDSPGLPGPVALLVMIHRKLGLLHSQMGRRDDAEKNFREAIAQELSRDPRGPANFSHFLALADSRRALADLLLAAGHRDESLTLLRQCRDDLDDAEQWAPPGRQTQHALNPRIDDLADSLEKAGDPNEAAAVRALARHAPPPERRPGPGPGRRPPPPPEDDF